MPRAYSTDLRERALAAYEAGEGRQSEIARRYRVGERTLSGWLKLAREEGRRHPKPRRGGTRPVGGEAATLAALVAERNDATLAEYADLLAERPEDGLGEHVLARFHCVGGDAGERDRFELGDLYLRAVRLHTRRH